MYLCHECIAKTRLSFPKFDYIPQGDIIREKCGACGKKRYCLEYQAKRKPEGEPQ